MRAVLDSVLPGLMDAGVRDQIVSESSTTSPEQVALLPDQVCPPLACHADHRPTVRFRTVRLPWARTVRFPQPVQETLCQFT
jgi:hypothetical protein